MKHSLVMATAVGALLAFATSASANPFVPRSAKQAASATSAAAAAPASTQAPSAAPAPATPVVEEPQKDVRVEEVVGLRIGKVNGMHLYRGTANGQNTYHFESSDDLQVKRQLAKPLSNTTEGGSSPEASNSSRPNLPSSVGRPAPRK